ncbi:IclR family transcriptional regulator [Natronolimnobius baerhuensis]|uniref:IclR family transcriptional regulator n=1 Tax=Natronolimnobius baerhuensis TaxID=253108 RepID=A0A202EB29_9EURY|nr:IclR family transcriptional regulator [Natronolimnobius baerhuensis]OVE85434.1 IclR family transcriptional regulator [Natronolimnobius baerhuensis]
MHDQRTGSESGKTIKSIETMLEILESIRRREEAGVTEIASDIGMSKSTVHHYVKTLELYNCLEKTNGRYRFGLQFLTYGGQARTGHRLYQLAKDDVDRLAAETGEEVRLAVEQQGYGITLYQSTGEHIDTARSYVGRVEELHCTAAGKAFLAALPENRVDTLLEDLDLKAFTPQTITDRTELEAELEQIRSRDVAFDDEERHEGVRCVAVSITNRSGELLGAISVSGPTARISGERFTTTIPNQLQNIVGVVEVNTTYSEWAEPQ